MMDYIILLILILVVALVLILWNNKHQYTGGSNVGKAEFEARFLNVDVDDIKKRLKKMGAEKVHDEILLKRNVFHLAKTDPPLKGFARVRDEGKVVTMTSKIYPPDSKYPIETEVSINEDFESGKSFVESLGLENKAYQETYREKWRTPGFKCNEVVFDTIPGMPTYIEIDCHSEEEVKKVTKLLGLDFKDARFGSYAKTYEEEYGIPQDVINNQIPLLVFKTAEESLGPHVTKNKELFIKTLEKQNKKYKN